LILLRKGEIMPLNKSKGNMYDWITHTHAHLGGECPHQCTYCYVDNPRFGRPAKYQGPLRMIEKEFDVKYGAGKTIFIENCNDLFASKVPVGFITAILQHIQKWPDNTYVFQTKNPQKMFDVETFWKSPYSIGFPEKRILGCTIETNRLYPAISRAPHPEERMKFMTKITGRKFLTIEPVLDFDIDILASWIDRIRPEFLNLGADSKNHGLPEPTVEKIMAFTEKLKEYGIELREKHNLARLKP
jgi:DNA repair photolyase